jgi:hypothetical protein
MELPKRSSCRWGDQHDPLIARKMIQNLPTGRGGFPGIVPGLQDSRTMAGTYVVSMAQPKMGVVRWMLGARPPDNEYTRTTTAIQSVRTTWRPT